MKPSHSDPAAFELLHVAPTPGRASLDLDPSEQKRLEDSASTPVTSGTRSWLWKIVFFLPLLAGIAPIAALLASSPRLSSALGENGCLPNGDFVLPYTSSIWEASQSFSITMGFSGGVSQSCTSGPSIFGDTIGTQQSCLGYTFTTVKIIDIVFDVLVGRLGQVALVATAYSVFRSALISMMHRTEVGYDAFSAVVFKTGTFASLPALSKHAVSKPPTAHTIGYRWLFLAMALSTAYIIALPTMVSSMTGYRSYYVPYLSNFTYALQPPNSTSISDTGGFLQATILNETKDYVDCNGSLKPIWGRLSRNVNEGTGLMVIESDLWVYYGKAGKWERNWMDYYKRNQYIYDACEGQPLANCSAAQIETWVEEYEPYAGSNKTLPPPVYGIEIFPPQDGHYTHWDCGGGLFRTAWMTRWTNSNDVKKATLEIDSTGFCQAGQRYVWGFSFVLTFAVCCLHLVFTILMYLVWIGGRARHGQTAVTSGGLFKDAALMVSKAQAQYGEDIGSWSAKSLEKEVVHGRKGMTFRQIDEPPARTSGADFGDPNSGDWGGI